MKPQHAMAKPAIAIEKSMLAEKQKAMSRNRWDDRFLSAGRLKDEILCLSVSLGKAIQAV